MNEPRVTTPDPDSLGSHAERIRASGILGRAGRLRQLFDFLIASSIAGKVPKEADIAVDVLERGGDFDSTQDAVVRVYIHKLRGRLREYYAGPGALEASRLGFARGEYRLVLEQAGHHEVP